MKTGEFVKSKMLICSKSTIKVFVLLYLTLTPRNRGSFFSCLYSIDTLFHPIKPHISPQVVAQNRGNV